MKKSLWKEIENIYSKLQDEESKLIFFKRLQYSLENNDAGPIRDIVIGDGYTGEGPLRALISKLEKYKEEEIIIQGAIRGGEIIKMALEGYGFKNIVAFCDNDKSKQGRIFGNMPVISVEEACRVHSNAVFVIMAVYHLDEIKEQLLSLGINEANIFVSEMRYEAYGRQYFDTDIISDHSKGVFIDGGCFDLGDSIQFLALFPNAEKVYAFEPDRENYENCLKKIKYIQSGDKIEMINKGLYDSTGEKHFVCDGDSSRISDGSSETIQTISLDDFMENKEKVSFIKMDIEGAEMDALEGARKTIIRDKPDLAICIYHKNSDILDILRQILDIYPNYRLYIRHYSEYHWETVVYAVE